MYFIYHWSCHFVEQKSDKSINPLVIKSQKQFYIFSIFSHSVVPGENFSCLSSNGFLHNLYYSWWRLLWPADSTAHSLIYLIFFHQNDFYIWIFLLWWMDMWFRYSHRPQVLLVCHSDEGKEPPLSETLLFCSVGALRSLLLRSPCRCQQRVDLYAVVHRWLLRDRETILDLAPFFFFFFNQSQLMFWLYLQLSSSSKS